jgi:hypothetical protein
MATYTYQQLYGSGSLSGDLASATTYTFTFTNPSGNAYFFMETIPNTNSFYDSSSPENILGTFNVSASILNSLVTSSYVMGIGVPDGNSSFEFEPVNNISGVTLYLKGTGMYSLTVTP